MTAQGRTIVVGVDGSPASVDALAWADGLATRCGDASLVVVHSWTPAMAATAMSVPEERLDADARDVLTDVLDSVELHNPHTAEVARDVSPAAALIAYCAEADLLVTGTRGLNRLERILLGSVAVQCAQHAPCPFVAVPAGSPQPGGTITVGYDDSAASRVALRWAVGWSAAEFADVRVVTVAEQQGWIARLVPGNGSDGIDPATLQRELREVLGTDTAPEASVVSGDDGVADALVRASADSSMLAVGSRGLGGFRGLLLGSVSQRCLETSPRPVAVLRSD